MSLSMYQASVPVFIRALGNLSRILSKGADDADTRRIDPAVFITARLAPDMFPLSRQVQIATDTAKGCAARLAGNEIPSYPDVEASFPELEERIQRTLDFLRSVSAAQFEGSEDRTITLRIGGRDTSFSGKDYLLTFALPNFFFHVTTAYDILRHNGVALTKGDYLGSY